MRERKKRTDYLAEAAPTNEWPVPPLETIDLKHHEAFRSRCLAVDLWVLGAPEREILRRAGMSARQARRLFIACAAYNALARKPFGYFACLPGFRMGGSPRRRVHPFDKLCNSAGTGLSGALSALFEKYPDIGEAMNRFVQKREVSKGLRSGSITPKKLHEYFLSLCRNTGLDKRYEYPFSVRNKGYEAVRRWYRKRRYEHPILSAVNELGNVGAQDTAAAYYAVKQTRPRPALLAYERVEADEHKLDGMFSLHFPGEFGELRTLMASRIWALVAVEARTTAVLSSRVAFGERYGRADATQLILQAAHPPKPCKLRFSNNDYRYIDGAAYPAELPGFDRNGWQELAWDSDAAHMSPKTWQAIEHAIGCRVVHERVKQPGARRIIERFFNMLSEAASWLPSATGNRSDSPTRRNPEEAAMAKHIDVTLATQLLDLLCRNHNVTPSEACGGLTPLQMLEHLMLKGEAYISRLDALGPDKLWQLLPSYTCKLNRLTRKGRLGPIYVELFGARYSSPSLANAQELLQLDDDLVTMFVQEDARYAFLVHNSTQRFLGQVAVTGKFADTPHNIGWRQAYESYARTQRMEARAGNPHTMIGFLKGLSALASSDNKAATVMGGAMAFMDRYGAGEVTPVGTTEDDLARLQASLSRLHLDDDDESTGAASPPSGAGNNGGKGPPRSSIF